MAYDVVIAAAKADRAKADLLARRLRALKFSVRFDAKREHSTPTARDLGDTNKAQSVLVLWSKAACDTGSPDSDWVHAIAHLARSRQNALVQADLDATTPDEPFDADERHKLAGMGPKRVPTGFSTLVEALGTKQGRTGLTEWLAIEPRDKAAQEAWKKAHRKDPLSASPKPKAKPKTTAAKQMPAAKPKPEAPKKPAEAPASAATAAAASSAGKAAAASATPPVPSAPKTMTLKPPTQTQFGYRRPHPATLHDESDEIEVGWKMLGPIMAGIALMLLMAWAVRITPGQSPSMPAIANAGPVYSMTCPAGQVPRSLLETQPLRTGPVIDDTEED